MTTSAVQSPFSLVPGTDPGTSLSIPLQLIRLGNDAVKVGISVTLSDPDTGATAEGILYEFDTGGKGFFTAFPPGQAIPKPSTTFGQATAIAPPLKKKEQQTGNDVSLLTVLEQLPRPTAAPASSSISAPIPARPLRRTTRR